MDKQTPPADPDRRLVVELKREGPSIQASQELEALFRSRLLSLFRRWSFSPEDSEELIQDTLMRVHQNIGDFRQDAKFSTWVYRIAKNLAKNRMRHDEAASRKGNEVAIEPNAAEEFQPSTVGEPTEERLGPEAETLRREQEAALKAAIQQLPKRNRQCFLLWIRGYKLKDIARILQVKEGTVKAQVHQAKQRLAKQLENFR